LESRYAETDLTRLPLLAEELVRLKPHVRILADEAWLKRLQWLAPIEIDLK
jgi:hypothetical protein